MKEFELIAQLAQILRQPPAEVVGIGDDCAVVGTNNDDRKLLYCVDTLTETIHFDRAISAADEIGYKAAAVNISDIAAMGGEPKFLLVSLQIPQSESAEFAIDLYRGIDRCCAEYGVFVIGGDTTSAYQCSISITAVGELAGTPLLRTGAEVGDNLFVSGVIGQAWAGLCLSRGKLEAVQLSNAAACLQRHKLATARVELGRILQRSQLATSAIDISDGLLSEVGHLASASQHSIELYLDSIPLCLTADAAPDLVMSAIAGGDDYELLFTSKLSEVELRAKLGPGFDVAKIGCVISREKKPVIAYRTVGSEPLDLSSYASGYEHG